MRRIIELFPFFRWEMRSDGVWEAHFTCVYGRRYKYTPRPVFSRGEPTTTTVSIDLGSVATDLRTIQRGLQRSYYMQYEFALSGGKLCEVD